MPHKSAARRKETDARGPEFALRRAVPGFTGRRVCQVGGVVY